MDDTLCSDIENEDLYMRMDSTDLTIRESEDEDVYASVEKNIEITKHGNCQQIPVSSFCFLLYCPVFCLVII